VGYHRVGVTCIRWSFRRNLGADKHSCDALRGRALYETLLSDSGRVVTAEALNQMRLRSNRLSEGMSPTSFDGEESGSVENRSKEAEIWDGPHDNDDMEDRGNCMEATR